MKIEIALFLVLFCFLSCKEEGRSCEEDRIVFGTQIFEGFIHLCNAIPASQKDLEGKATIELLTESSISVRLISDTTFLDTVLYFDIRCGLVEDMPLTFLVDSTGKDVGQYAWQTSLIFSFGYPNCLNNSFFEGLAER